ncbi:hypothetical protein G7074_07955 [Pedobacter sp. HDW13]|uniref:hypothetical protein n=1 Tax=Pedobacter sp. HDW13 TaxID=2714940 RepID=UPI00140B1591|nr:hypothetical protein [Pedobacter sp. HDW13]QIL39214.1 hypothetical protein G7074_07955 [Pedobacter sp. HDW13]
MKIILGLTWICSFYIAFIFRNNLNFASYEDVYLQRSSTEGIGTDVFTGYLSTWLANVMIPICAAYGLFAKKKWYFIASISGALICYMSKADKSIFLFPVFILALYYFLKNSNLKNSFSSIGIALSSIMTFTLVVPTNIFFIAIFWMRTLGTGGILTNFYQKFFMDHPLTYYSHVRIINAITGAYPYGDLAVGQVVGKEYWSDDMNANANFWAIDGIASLGEAGIIIASLLLFCIFLLFNRICAGYNKLFIICILIPYITILLNQSLFSSLVTGGGFWILIILLFKSTINNPYINENFNHNRS